MRSYHPCDPVCDQAGLRWGCCGQALSRFAVPCRVAAHMCSELVLVTPEFVGVDNAVTDIFPTMTVKYINASRGQPTDVDGDPEGGRPEQAAAAADGGGGGTSSGNGGKPAVAGVVPAAAADASGSASSAAAAAIVVDNDNDDASSEDDLPAVLPEAVGDTDGAAAAAGAGVAAPEPTPGD